VVKVKGRVRCIWPSTERWKQCSEYFYIMKWNYAGYTAPLMALMKAGACKTGKSQQQNRLLLKSEPDGTGHKIIILTPSPLLKSSRRNKPSSSFSSDEVELDPG